MKSIFAKQAFEIKYLAPTNTKGARVKVSTQAGAREYPWDYELNGAQNAAKAAEDFADALGWKDLRPGFIGATKAGWVVVFSDENSRAW